MLQVIRVVGSHLNTPDIEKATAYYTEVMGLSVVEKADNGNAYISVGADHNNLVFVPSNERGLKTLLYEIDTEYSLQEVVSYYKQNGIHAEVKTDAEPGISELVEITDPDGNTINLFRESKKVGVGYKHDGIVPNKLGHIALNVKDVKKAVHFYETYLGFKVSDWMADFFCFTRCTSDHHNMNFIQSTKAEKMQHIAFELRDMAHLTYSCDLLSKYEKPLIWGPVRHGIGHNISTYHYDYDGNIIELFCELDVINEKLGYFEPRTVHDEFPQKPRVWHDLQKAADLWGSTPPAVFRD